MYQTDRQTDGQTNLLYQYRASICSRTIKTEQNEIAKAAKSNQKKFCAYVNKNLAIANR